MTTTTASPTADGTEPRPAPGARRHPGAHEAYRLSYARVLRSEWIKLRTLRSTWIGLACVIVVLVGFGAIAAGVSTGSVTPQGGGGQPPSRGPLDTVLLGANFGVLLLGIIGCLGGAREYASRMITATIAAVPTRGSVVTAKALVLTALLLPVAVVGTLVAFFTGMAALTAGGGTTLALTDDGVLRAVLGTAAWLTVIALLGLALGILMRNTAASIGTLIGGVLILPGIAGALLPSGWESVLKYLPSNAAASFTQLTPPTGDLSAGAGALVLAGWLVLAVGGAVVAIRQRDV